MNARTPAWTCPRDGAQLAAGHCPDCGLTWPDHHGIPDLLDPPMPPPSAAQRAMRSGLVTRVYERWWRPAWSALGGGVGYAEEDAFLAAALAGRTGAALDLATGTGRYARALVAAGFSPVVALDASWPMLTQAARSAPAEVRLVHARADRVPLPAGSVQVVTSFGALHLFDQPWAVLAEVARVLAPGGRLVLHTACEHVEPMLRPVQQALTSTGLRFVRTDELLEQLEAVGLRADAWQVQGSVALVSATREPVAT